MKTIEVEFTIGDRVRVKETGEESKIRTVSVDEYELTLYWLSGVRGWLTAVELELVKPVIEWERVTNRRVGKRWAVYDSRYHGGIFIATCPTPEEGMALAEATEKLWKGEK